MIKILLCLFSIGLGAESIPYFEARIHDSSIHFNFNVEQLNIQPSTLEILNKLLQDSHSKSSNQREHFYKAIDQLQNESKISANAASNLKQSWEDSFGYLFTKKEITENSPFSPSEKRKIRARIYEETKAACLNTLNSQKFQLKSIQRMQNETYVVDSLSQLNQPGPYEKTEIKVYQMDTLHLVKQLQDQDYHPVALNFANKNRVGGGVTRGAQAQEEEIFRRSSYCFGLDIKYNSKLSIDMDGNYLIPEFGAIYTPYVEVCRESEGNGYAFIQPFEVDFIASAAYNSSDAPEDLNVYKEGFKKKIRTILRLGIKTGHDAIVLGAFGCGAFKNDPTLVATLFKEVLYEKEFSGYYRMVAFGIVDDTNNSNFTIFQSILG